MNIAKRIIEHFVITTLTYLRSIRVCPRYPAPNHILAIESFGVGDVVCALPAVRALKAAYPEAEMVFVTSRTALQFCEGLPFIDRCEVCPRSWREVWHFLQRWRSRRHDTLAVLLNDGWWQNLSAHLLGPRWACGYLYRSRLDTHYHPERLASATWDKSYQQIVAPETHLVRRSLQAALPALSMNMPEPVGRVPELATLPQGMLTDRIKGMLSAERVGIVLHPGTKGKTKRWPMERWRELIHRLPETWELLITGGPSEAHFCHELAAAAGRPVTCLAGELILAQEATLMSKVSCFVGPDCGPAHLASAVGCLVVMLMGPTAPETSSPFWNKNIVIRAVDGAIGSDINTDEAILTMQSIAVSKVVSAIDELLGR